MAKLTAREHVPYFSHPTRQFLLMLIVVGLVGFGGYLAYPSVAPVFLANPLLNGFIGFVFFIGVIACFAQVAQIRSSVRWIIGYVAAPDIFKDFKAPLLLAPLAALLRSRDKEMQIGASSAASIRESVATRMDEERDITRYIVSLLIFLGLLGTFWGLATTIPAVVETIKSLAPQEGDSGIEIFGELMGGLEAQLGGMGTAFGSSLLGLAGSLVVGLLELFASHGQNRFYRELEEWLSTITRLSFAGAENDGADLGQAGILLEQMSVQMETINATFSSADESRQLIAERLEAMTASFADMSKSHRDEMAAIKVGDRALANALEKVADGQERVIATLEAIEIEREKQQAAAGEEGGDAFDAESRMRLRSIDVQLLRILEELAAGRQESMADLRAELTDLTRAVRALSGRG